MHIRAPVRNDQEGNGSGLLSTQEHEESKWGEKQHRGSVFYSVFEVREFFCREKGRSWHFSAKMKAETKP